MGVFIETSKRCAQSGSTPLLHLAMISLSTKKSPLRTSGLMIT
ncbi:hypothetical protein SAMN05878442_0248 [Vreelandella aquamarina]|nr:hypothetical protein SAMN05878442_0248 [Halomonas meridiana]